MKYEIYKTRSGHLIPVVFPQDHGDDFAITVPNAVKVSEGHAVLTTEYGITVRRMKRQPFPIRNNIFRDHQLLTALQLDFNINAYDDTYNEIAPPLTALYSTKPNTDSK